MKRLALILGIVVCMMFAVSFSANAEFDNYVLTATCSEDGTGTINYTVAGDATADWRWHSGDCLTITVSLMQDTVEMAKETQTYNLINEPVYATLNWEVSGSFVTGLCGDLLVRSLVEWRHASCTGYVHVDHAINKQTPVSCPCEMYGCTPGYWKAVQHFDSWPAPYVPYGPSATLFDNAADSNGVSFEDAFPGMTLLQVLQQGGGGLKALGRHTVAALLNAGSGFYPLTPAEVISMFNAVYPGTDMDYEALKNDYFEKYNEQDCPLN